jgi:ABC-type sugar transport system permease subunit
MAIDDTIARRLPFAFSDKGKRSIIAWLAVAPALTITLLYRYIPVGYNFYLSFHTMSYTGEMTFVGLEHYAQALNDPVFTTSVLNTVYLLGTIPVGIAIALGVALLLNQKFFGSNAFRSVFFIPYITMMVAVAVVWQYMFKTQGGVINFVLLNIELIEDPLSWLSSEQLSFVSVFIVQVWKTVGFYMIIILAGLQGISQQVYEVARIDGATQWQRFRYVTLPLLKPTLGVCALVGMVTTFRAFDLIMTMLPNGGPNHGAEILLTWMYKQAFSFGNFGYGAVLTVVLFVMMVGFALLGRTFQRGQYQ